jgi:methanogenic corrinoid protein MtbC1
MEKLENLRNAILTIKEEEALEATRQLLDAGTNPQSIIDAETDALLELGRRWNAGELYLPEIVAASGIFAKCNALVEPVLLESGSKQSGPLIVLATVKGDLHDLGKNIVGALMKTGAFEVEDLGKNVQADRIVESVRELKPCLVGLSALLTTTMPEQQNVIQNLEEAGLRSKVKVMVGGAPVTQEWANEIGADGYASSAPEAVQVALNLVGRP